VNSAKSSSKELAVKDVKLLFEFCILNDNTRDSFVYFYDLRALNGIDNQILMLMLYQTVKQDVVDGKVLLDLYKMIKDQKNFKWNQSIINILMKGFSKIGHMKEALDQYERIFTLHLFPQPHHLLTMLVCASNAGDSKYFSRFYYRMRQKKIAPMSFTLKALVENFGSHKSIAWTKSKEANIKLMDILWMIEFSCRVRNYKRAAEFVIEARDLHNNPATILFELFMKGVVKDIPQKREEAKEILRNLKKESYLKDKVIIAEYSAWIRNLITELGDKATDVPKHKENKKIEPIRITRKKQKMILYGERKKKRYVSKFSNDSKMFQFAPEYIQRIEDWKKEALKSKEKREIEAKVDSEIKQQLTNSAQ